MAEPDAGAEAGQDTASAKLKRPKLNLTELPVEIQKNVLQQVIVPHSISAI